MNWIKYLLILFIVTHTGLINSGCNGKEIDEPRYLDSITLLNPDYIKSKVGSNVQFNLQVPSKGDFSYRWIYQSQVFSTEQNPLYNCQKAGSGNVTVIIKDDQDNERVITTKLFVAKNKSKQVLSYYPSYKAYNFNQTIWDKITHICLSFGIISVDGTVDISAIRSNSMTTIINDAHAKGVNVMLSIGGGAGANADASYGFTLALADSETRAKVVNNLKKILEENQLDGIDVDYEHWQWGINETNNQRSNNLKLFYQELNEALDSEVYYLTASVSMETIKNGYFTALMSESLDFINLMIYDDTGGWASSKVGPHASWEFYTSSITSAINANLPKEKLLAGVPFYGKKFPNAPSPTGALGMSYADIVKQYPGAENKNEIEGQHIYYDGIPLITQKSQYILDNQLGGIMIWEITQDSDIATKSLLNVIDALMKTSE